MVPSLIWQSPLTGSIQVGSSATQVVVTQDKPDAQVPRLPVVFVKQVVPSGKLSPVHIEDCEVAEVQVYGEQQSMVILVYWEVYLQTCPPAAQSVEAVVVSSAAVVVSELAVVVASELVVVVASAVVVSELAVVVVVVVSELAVVVVVVVSELAVVVVVEVSELAVVVVVVVSELAVVVVVVVAWSLHTPSIQLRLVSQLPTLLAHDSPSASLLRYWQYQSTAPVGVVPEGM